MKRKETGKWCISHDGELYHSDDYDTKDDAIVGARGDYKYDSFYVAKVVELEFEANDINLSDDAFEGLSESLFEEVGEVSEQWEENITQLLLNELQEMLSDTVVEWINKNNLHPKCYGITGDCKIEAE
jgi:hypothetical protein